MGYLLVQADARAIPLGDASVDAVITDPPYGLKFMGQRWDYRVPGVEVWAEIKRVMKPGAHALIFGGSRTYHRMACNVEDAGLDIRDCLMWLHGSGFPKSLDVGKALDKAAGARRAQVQPGNPPAYQRSIGNHRPWMDDPEHTIDGPEPVTEAARQWSGWGTALKPAHEPIILARKPLEGAVAANVLSHGCGGLNIDGCRIGAGKEPGRGRWPANLLLDDEAAVMLDAQSGRRVSGAWDGQRNHSKTVHTYGPYTGHPERPRAEDAGGASRFFYTAKASPSERGAGNIHPTVKPLALMEWLVILITPPGGLLLDPFVGSGTTCRAAERLGRRAIGLDLSLAYLGGIAARRCAAPLQPVLAGVL